MPDVLALILAACAGIVTVGGATGVLWWLIKPRVQKWAQEQIIGPLHETRHQVTVNHHSSDNPTVLDRLDDVHAEVVVLREEQIRVRDDLSKHVLRSSAERQQASREQLAMWAAIEAVAKAEPPADV